MGQSFQYSDSLQILSPQTVPGAGVGDQFKNFLDSAVSSNVFLKLTFSSDFPVVVDVSSGVAASFSKPGSSIKKLVGVNVLVIATSDFGTWLVGANNKVAPIARADIIIAVIITLLAINVL